MQSFDDPEAAFRRIDEIYRSSVETLKSALAAFRGGERRLKIETACYPYISVAVQSGDVGRGRSRAYGTVPAAGVFGTTVTRPSLFKSYYLEQIELLLQNHGQPVSVGLSNRPIPLPFVIEAVESGIPEQDAAALAQAFPMPDLARVDDSIANGTYVPGPDGVRPLALFDGERVDYSLVRLAHYTGTTADCFQRFVLFTNYQRYVDEFIEYGRREVEKGATYKAFVEPGNVITHNPRMGPPLSVRSLGQVSPQMPAYHLMRDLHEGITLVNIGIGPSNAKTITDHLAVLRPHCWIMVGHCGGLRKTQLLGDYVLAHAYARYDNVLNEDLPVWVPVPPIAEIQVALTGAVGQITGLSGAELKTRLRTGTVFTTDDRDWELRHSELSWRLHQSRAIAVDMESATIAANGYRFRVPYGTLLCVSDKPLHGELKLPGMARAFYQQRISQHLRIGIAAIENLSAQGVEALHSRKLRSFDEPAFR
ncbi:MAG TPA: AMP nucleosidase [Kiloniellaceae bacterium]|nr:AMP nucleosidase [Kiloniellaceae bacterium]